ncbi:hypothetical protein [Fibrella forsythiae]|uniref:Uncharacterized protein n=1 Tax=Fibrella forsythiae TaxID=2817061 RepID=A0ABS3JRB4_9BACT|nr:hypothetical protein [Fibrella forsythiae]MBO0952541.1 hypothetical protein [Fibrella forsythiae]
MTKPFYQTLCASLGLSLAAGLFQSWLHFQRGVDLYGLASFQSWFVIGNFIALITASLLLTYYDHKHFKAAFWAGLVATLISLATFFYLLLASLYPLLGQYLRVATGMGTFAFLVYGVTLATSGARSRPWLRWAGYVVAILYGIQLAALVWFNDIPPYPPPPPWI